MTGLSNESCYTIPQGDKSNLKLCENAYGYIVGYLHIRKIIKHVHQRHQQIQLIKEIDIDKMLFTTMNKVEISIKFKTCLAQKSS
jgi:hypothetical protein